MINAAGFCGTPNVDACARQPADVILANVALPVTVASACAAHEIPFAQIGSGCVYNGPAPDAAGWRESDAPNFSFRSKPCSFYSGSKALCEEAIAGIGRSWIWRIRMPFSDVDSPKNLISKLLTYKTTYLSPPNSMSHLGDCVRACIDIWEQGLPFGTYNVCNAGTVTTGQIVEMIKQILKPARKFEFFEHGSAMQEALFGEPRSNCVLSCEKLAKAGIHVRPVMQALQDSLDNWHAAP